MADRGHSNFAMAPTYKKQLAKTSTKGPRMVQRLGILALLAALAIVAYGMFPV